MTAHDRETQAHLSRYPISMPGSKRAVIASLWPLMPRPKSGRVIVPFFGTGADSYYFHRQGLTVAGSDAQPMLVDLHNDAIGCYDRCAKWIAGVYDRTPAQYLRLRAEHNHDPQPWTYYLLSRLSFNKLVRHNRKGHFNVPPGDLPADPLPSRESMGTHAAFVDRLEFGGVYRFDFDYAISTTALDDDLVYLDPPYLGGFDGYTARRFDHDLLFDALARLTEAGVSWACSNSPAAIERMPPEATIHRLDRGGSMNSDTTNRGRVGEILAVFDSTTR